jgi:serine/threonine protein kinase
MTAGRDDSSGAERAPLCSQMETGADESLQRQVSWASTKTVDDEESLQEQIALALKAIASPPKSLPEPPRDLSALEDSDEDGLPYEDPGWNAMTNWRVLMKALRILGKLHKRSDHRSRSLTVVVRSAISGKVYLGPEELKPWTTVRHLQCRIQFGLGLQFLHGTEILQECTDLERMAVEKVARRGGTQLELSAHFRSRYPIFRPEPGEDLSEDEKSLLERLDSKFIIMEKLSTGSYGSVYKAMCMNCNIERPSFVAIKMSKVEEEGGGIPVAAVREVAFIRMTMAHPNIVSLHADGGVYPTRRWFFLVNELVDTDLHAYIREHGRFENPQELRNVAHQCCSAMHHCHVLRVIHRDLKPQNILVNVTADGPVMKIADFGMARVFSLPLRPYTAEVVTLWYRAIELLLGESRCGTGLDIWSMACVITEMATGRPLFPASTQIEMLYRIFRVLGTPTEDVWTGVSALPYWQKVFPSWDDTGLQQVHKAAPALGEDGIDMLRKCFSYNPQARLSSRQMCKHPFFAGQASATSPSGTPARPCGSPCNDLAPSVSEGPQTQVSV